MLIVVLESVSNGPNHSLKTRVLYLQTRHVQTVQYPAVNEMLIKGQLRMDNPKILATLIIQDTGRRQAKQKTQLNTEI